ncbi:hypothetical protein M404DRAFT_1000236 [Pisolithus tinctorius Marx 270]|uniref:Uncharacterized protein n=1 Tax=Pisolithus tinctorius Marx 270 TaxID=870435 RepID=A0A0C3P9Z9_PISTI|nr:hypothetical protein M404DRAFT_1000236 [Pisolithus tinctorius Marx 270]
MGPSFSSIHVSKVDRGVSVVSACFQEPRFYSREQTFYHESPQTTSLLSNEPAWVFITT